MRFTSLSIFNVIVHSKRNSFVMEKSVFTFTKKTLGTKRSKNCLLTEQKLIAINRIKCNVIAKHENKRHA